MYFCVQHFLPPNSVSLLSVMLFLNPFLRLQALIHSRGILCSIDLDVSRLQVRSYCATQLCLILLWLHNLTKVLKFWFFLLYKLFLLYQENYINLDEWKASPDHALKVWACCSHNKHSIPIHIWKSSQSDYCLKTDTRTLISAQTTLNSGEDEHQIGDMAVF